jgi:sugar lactone lactonase YvrE
MQLHAKVVAHFDPAAGELPEGLALTDDTAFVGFAATSQVVRVDLNRLESQPFGQLPVPVSSQGFMTGLALASNGDLYAGLASFVPAVQAGIYRIPKAGGDAVLFAKDGALPFPNALAFDSAGALFVSDSGTGSVFRIDPTGRAERWSTNEALTGDEKGCNGAGPGFAIGANGLVVENDDVYVVNMDKATLLRIPRNASGQAGSPSVVAGPDCDALGGADGLAVAPDGSFVVAVNRQNKVMRVARDGSIRTLVSGPPLDFPATVAYRGSSLYATNFALQNASAGKTATPGLIHLE